MPRRAKVTTIEILSTNLQRFPCPGGQRNLLMGFEKKEKNLYSAAVPTRGPSIAAVRPATLGLTPVDWAVMAVGEVVGQCKHKVLASDPFPTSPPLR